MRAGRARWLEVINAHGFTSAFAPELDAYLAFKEKMGFYGDSRIWYLKRFDAYCTAHDRAAFDLDTVEGWVAEQLARSGRYRSWMSYIRDVGRWLQVRGYRDAYVLSDRWKAQVVPAHPYLLSRYEIEAFFTAAATLNAHSPWRCQAVAFFTLMHSCGLRTGETRLLRPEHVHLRDGTLDVVSSKGNRSRRLPLTGDVTEVLAGCDRVSATRLGPSRRTFFVSATGNQVTAATVGKIFHRIWNQAGLPQPAGGQQPRPYDFRHHFAYANVERWMRQGKDVTAMLPYLARIWGTRASSRATTTSIPRRTSCTPTPTSRPRASRCCRRSSSNETRPENRRPGLLHLRQELPAHIPTHGGPTLTENDRGLPDQPGMLRRLPGRSPAHRTRPRDLRPLRPGPPERLAGLDERPAALRGQDHRAAAEHRQSVPDVLLRRRPSPSSRSARQPRPYEPQPARESRSSTSPNPRHEQCSPPSPAAPRNRAGTECC